MKPPNTLTDAELLKYADEHLQYEVEMLTWLSGIMAFLAIHKEEGYLPWAMNNGLLNSYALHVRNLINFLFSRSKRKDFPTDIIIEDYIDSRINVSSLITLSPLLEEALTKASKQVAHLSVERIKYEQAGKEWKFLELYKQIRASLALIVPHIPNSRISGSLRQKLLQSEVHIPIVDTNINKSPGGDCVGATFTLRMGSDGRPIQGILE